MSVITLHDGYGNVIAAERFTQKRVVSVKLEEHFIQIIDEFWQRHGYENRSQFIREAIVWYMNLIRAIERGLCVCDCNKKGAKKLEDVLYEAVTSLD